MLNNKADQKSATEKPSTNSLHNIIINALMTNKNSPKVKIVTGKVNKISKGFTNKFNNARTNATTIEVEKPSTETPPRKFESNVTRIAVTNNLTIKYIVEFFIILILQQKV